MQGSPAVVANGGGVCKKSYYNSKLPGTKFCTPDYALSESAAETYADKALKKLKNKGYISDDSYWSQYEKATGTSQTLALLDKATGGKWTSEKTDSSIHWAQPHIISLSGKKIIEDKQQWLDRLDKDITPALFLALIDKATGGLKVKYAERKTDHWGRNHLDSLCDKELVTTPGAWTNFDGTVPRSNVMALTCNALVG